MEEKNKNIYITILSILVLCMGVYNLMFTKHTINGNNNILEEVDEIVDTYNVSLNVWKDLAIKQSKVLNKTLTICKQRINEGCEICVGRMKESYMLGAVMGADWYDEYANIIGCKS